MTDAAGDEADEDLAGLRFRELDLLNGERLPELLQHRGADPHRAEPTPLDISPARGIDRLTGRADGRKTRSPPRAPAAMEIGTVVTFRGRSWYVRGFDPHGVRPRYVYLEDVRTGRRLSVLRERCSHPTLPDGAPRPCISSTRSQTPPTRSDLLHAVYKAAIAV